MPEKSVRQMGKVERKRRSLEARTFRSVAMFSILIGLICFALGFLMYLNGLAQESMEQAAALSEQAVYGISQVCEPSEIAAQIKAIYRANPDSKTDPEGYYARFNEVTETTEYSRLRVTLKVRRTELMSDFFYAYPDEETGAIIFIADTDPREGHEYPAGKVVKIPGFIQKYFFWTGHSQFPRTFFFLPGKGLRCVSGAFINGTDASDGCLFVMIKVKTVLKDVGTFGIRFFVAVLLVILIGGGLFVRKIRKTVVKPINEIAEAANNYTKDRKEGKTLTDHFAALNIKTGDEIENLSLIMADMERDIDSYTEDLTKATAEKARISTELDMAAQIQTSMLPHIFPPYPDRTEFEIYASMDPAKEVGGDFYDFFMIDEDHLAMVIADVSGKGVPAALFMMVTKSVLKSTGLNGLYPAQILGKTNALICANNQMDMFITVWLGILEISTGRLFAANAGHEYPAIKQPDGAFELIKDRHGAPVGGFDDEVYEEYELQLKPGAKLFVYTDGVAEAMDAQRKQFGTDRMLAALNAEANASPEKLLGNVRASVKDFVKDAEQFDDITMLCLYYKGDI